MTDSGSVGGDPIPQSASADVDLRGVFDAIDEGFCVCEVIVDEDGVAIDYRFLDTNPLFEEMTGLSDAVGRTALELVPDLEPHWVETYARAGLAGERIRFQQGSEAMGRWFDVFATPLDRPRQFAIVFKDMTAQHLAEISMRETGERFQELLDELPLIVWVHDAHGEQEFVNLTYCEYFGVTREEMKGDRWQMLVEPETGAAYNAEFTAAVNEQRRFHGEVRVQNGEGEWRTLESWGSPRFDTDGRYVGLVGTSADVTEARAALEAERDARQRAETMQRIALGLASAHTVDHAAVAVVDGLALTDIGAMMLWIERDDHLCIVAASGVPEEALAERTAVPLTSNQPISISFRNAEVLEYATGADIVEHHPEVAGLRQQLGFESGMVVPIVDGAGESIAVMAVTSEEPFWFTPERKGLVEVVALQAGGAFERVHQQARERLARDRAAFVARAVAELESCDTVAAQLDRLTELLVPDVVDFVSIEVPDLPESFRRVVKHHDRGKQRALDEPSQLFVTDTGESLTGGAGGRVIPIATAAIDTEALLRDDARELFAQLGVRAHLAVPIPIGHPGFRGALLAGITDPDRSPLGSEDVDFFLELVRHASPIVSSTASRQRELDASLRLQRALLPQGPADNPYVDVVAHYQAGDDGLEVGGDWYDTFSWPSGHYAIMVGDVVGHDVAATVAMGRLRVAVETLLPQLPPDPARIIKCIESCANYAGGPGFLTATCAVIDPSTSRLHYQSAGHPPGLVVRDGRAIWMSGSTGGPVCSLPTGSRVPASLTLDPDDLIVLYSDGLIERRHRSLQSGFDTLEAAGSMTTHYELEHVSHDILGAFDTETEDDTVVVAARYAPPSVIFRHRLEPRIAELGASRRQLLEWLEDLGKHRLAEVVILAVNEAMTNSIDHSGCQHIDVRASVNPTTGAIEVSVTDDGSWRPPSSHPGDRGRGIQIMRQTATSFRHLTDPTGTSTLMTFEPERP